MSAGARRFDRSEPRKLRRRRAKPKPQIVAHVSMFNKSRETDWQLVRYDYTITKQRTRSEKFCRTNVDKPPGEDGARWRCTCAIKACGHVAAVLAAENVAEGTLPSYDGIRNATIRDRARDSLAGILHVQLTALGEELVRWRWAERALRGTD